MTHGSSIRNEAQLRVFFTAPNIHPAATGEEWVAWKWAEALSQLVDLTVFAFQRERREPLADSLPAARVLTVPMPRTFSRFPRFEAMAKPTYPAYMRASRRALRSAGAIDIAHQMMPQAPRYPIALRGQGLPYVIGPLGGALETPPEFKSEGRNAVWFTHLRAFDYWRFRHDPWLRKSYCDASLVLGVAPYVRDELSAIPVRRFEALLELGVDDLPPLPKRAFRHPSELHLLHVGRGVRTKGLRDVIRAIAHLKDALPGLLLTSAGTGEDIEFCRREAEKLGVLDRVKFLGLIQRQEVELLYRDADIFVFPSYREPAGNVLYEAMRWGLPVIAAARGGPDWIVDEHTGIRVKVTDPVQYSYDIAAAIQLLAEDPAKRAAMGQAARAKLARTGFWAVKARALVDLYREVLTRAD